MVRPAARFRFCLLVGSLVLAAGCTGDEQGIHRLPLEPDASSGVLRVSPKASSLGWVGSTAQLTAQITSGTGTPVKGFTFSWRSLDEAIVAVDATGRITALAEGTARVVATTLNLADTATVAVERVPAAIVLDTDSLLFTLVGAQATIASTVRDGAGTTFATSVTWSSSDTAVATVSQSGGVVAVGQGRANVTARAGAISRVVRVRVSVGPSSVSVSPAGVSFDALGDSTQVVALVKDAAGGTLTGVQVTYSVTDTTVASVSATGVVHSRKVGATALVATADSVSRVAAVSVAQKVTSVTVTPDSSSLIPGDTASFTAVASDRNGFPTASLVTWVSSDTAVATVNSSGLVTAKGTAGTATVSAAAGGVVGTATIVNLWVPVATVEVEPSALSLALGATATLSATFRSAQGVVLVGPWATWTSDDPLIAQVGADGKVTALGAGTTWVHATANDTVAATDSASVTVTPPAPSPDLEVRYPGPTPPTPEPVALAPVDSSKADAYTERAVRPSLRIG